MLIAFATKEEADVAASALRADGVDAFVGNEHHAAVEWWAVLAFGGVQVLVPTRDIGISRNCLRERLASIEAVDPGEVAVRRDRWKSLLLMTVLVGPNLFLWLVWGGYVATTSILTGGVVHPQTDQPTAIIIEDPEDFEFPEDYGFPDEFDFQLPKHYGG